MSKNHKNSASLLHQLVGHRRVLAREPRLRRPRRRGRRRADVDLRRGEDRRRGRGARAPRPQREARGFFRLADHGE